MKECFIFGYPLKKPRSVKLWRQYFKKNKIKAKMNTLEIHPSKINKKISVLKNDQNFCAAAITMPYKEIFYKKTYQTDLISKYSKTVNLIKKKRNNIIGYNTDILAIIEILKKYKKKHIIIFGYGGVGKAIFNTFIKKYKKTFITIITSQKNLYNRKGRSYHFKKKLSDLEYNQADLLINATPIGSNLSEKYINKSIISNEQLLRFKKKIFFFDLVYKPNKTLVSKICKKSNVKYENGIKMNNLQAKKALEIVFKNKK